MTRKQLARYIVESTKDIFDMMIPLPLKIGAPVSKGGQKIVDGVSAMIGIAGDFSALIQIYCSRPAALEIATILLDEEMLEVNEDVEDTIGELANMLAGGMKGKFAESGANLEIAIPSVVSGREYSISQPDNVTGVRVPFDLGGENRLEVTLIVDSKVIGLKAPA
ncbi:MAG: chemotaxis protein CheX [Candidatus Poribacteria bacterium]|nr:chemotaxis protein CheX [Candidatus Poribacteria bacterium]